MIIKIRKRIRSNLIDRTYCERLRLQSRLKYFLHANKAKSKELTKVNDQVKQV